MLSFILDYVDKVESTLTYFVVLRHSLYNSNQVWVRFGLNTPIAVYRCIKKCLSLHFYSD